MEQLKLHSDHLFHFKKDISIVKLILQGGFQHRRWKETIPFLGLTQENFIVCFTDLRAQDLAFHRECYGKNALVMAKSWATKNRISPVRYIHKASPGMDEKYMHIKTLFRNAMKHRNTFHKIVSYLATSEMYLGDKLPQGDITLGNFFGEELIRLFETKCRTIEDAIGSSEAYCSLLSTMFLMIKTLHDELELRDAYLRAFIDDFTCPATEENLLGKILYDEREWRSIVFPEQQDFCKSQYIKKCIAEGFLPKEYNLTFSDLDVIAILVESEELKLEMIEFIDTNQTLLNATCVEKVLLFEEYDKENLEPAHTAEFAGNIHKIKMSRKHEQAS